MSQLRRYNRCDKIKIAVIALFTFSIFSNIGIAADGPIELTADAIEYDAKTDTAIATGGVTVTRDGGVLKGNEANYNFKTKDLSVTGNVTANKDDMNLKSDTLLSNASQEIIAKGNVVVVKGDSTLNTPELHYNQASGDVSMPVGGDADGPQAAIRGDVLNGNMVTNQYNAVGNVYLNSKEKDVQSTSDEATYTANGDDFYFTADGNVNIKSASRNITTYSDHATYNSVEDGKLVLTGNAVATQNNNIVRGNVLTVYMGDNVNIE